MNITVETLIELMGCEHMGDVTRAVRSIALKFGVHLTGYHGDWSVEDWDAIDILLLEK
ncbi:hypothetical protein LCGC14_1406120 [marine sediment metagenome]|uniref:Uncharacterized protein n=1 Tax=marine sediment metagenome TaxID=412755 RepID=A0A0F9MX76_9ZZZZ